ncbi:putative oxidase [Diaporthe ampelina]|uniref:Putative oxidase n=1 Tax=Diaporthe ampelina TaxID=1214573 RepID=A0A0G2HCR2_9PEZI|nr:putative oxidase [Diaporthe ampelina]
MARVATWLTAALAATATRAFPTPENMAKLARSAGAGSGPAGVGSVSDLHTTLVRLRDEQVALTKKRSSNPRPIDVSGDHAFVPPSEGDQRGPCPGLNALANHNYVSHDGAISVVEQITAATQVFNFGVDLATVLGLISVLFVGNPLSVSPSYSIGGPTPAVENLLDNLGGLLGTPAGLAHSHNIIESDASPTRGDLYQTGDAGTLNLDFFTELYESIEGGALTRDDMAAHAVRRFHHSVANNPYFWNGPVTNILMRPVGYVLANDILANHTDDNPDETTSKHVLRSFYGVTEDPDDGSLSHNPGHERIPENWFPRQTPYSILDFNAAEAALLLRQPELLSVGGNTGEVNSFAGIDLGDLTGGVFSAANLLEGNNLVCFALEVVKFAGPNALSSALRALSEPIELLGKAVAPLVDLSCPVFEDLTVGGTSYWDHAMELYPGANRSGSAL